MKQLSMTDIINVTGATWTCTDNIMLQDTIAGGAAGFFAAGVGMLPGASFGFMVGFFDAALNCS